MPELPEVETIARALAPRLINAQITEVRASSHPKWASAQFTKHAHVISVNRRGKHILIELDDARVLDIHLGMSGVVALVSEGTTPDPIRHERLLLTLDDGRGSFHLRLTDIRGFGHALLLQRDEQGALDLPALRAMGPEPMGDWELSNFIAVCSRRSAPIKALLLDQSVVAGIGNYLADEALFEARVHPTTPANELSTRKLRQLHSAVQLAIARSLASGGASLRDYRQLNGEHGGSQDELLAYGRAGLPCARCGTPLRKIVVAGRGTTYCPRCQRRR